MIDHSEQDRLERMTVPEILNLEKRVEELEITANALRGIEIANEQRIDELESMLDCEREANERYIQERDAGLESIKELEAQLREAMKGE